MTPGPTLIKKCTACAKLVEEETIESGNTFGARSWTDGRLLAPMLPDQLWLVMCPHCGQPLWIDELELAGEVDSFGEGGHRFQGARPYVNPTMDDYLALLAKGEAEAEKTRYLRVRAWWEGNDRRRDEDAAQGMIPQEIANLEALVAELDDADDGGLLMKAEALRELGKFSDARSLLENVRNPELRPFAERIGSLCDGRDRLVRQLIAG